jgi:hypothetical protein
MRIPTTAAALTALTALLLLASCRGGRDASAPATAQPLVYHNPAAPLHLTYPGTWTRLEFGERGTRALVAFLSPPDENRERQHLAFDVRRLSEATTIDQFNDAAIADAKQVFPRFELISSRKTTFGGHDAFRTIYTAGTERGAARIMQVLAIANGKACSAIYTARSQAAFDRSLPQVEQIIGSVKFE